MDDFIYYDIKFYTIPIIALKTKHKRHNYPLHLSTLHIQTVKYPKLVIKRWIN